MLTDFNNRGLVLNTINQGEQQRLSLLAELLGKLRQPDDETSKSALLTPSADAASSSSNFRSNVSTSFQAVVALQQRIHALKLQNETVKNEVWRQQIQSKILHGQFLAVTKRRKHVDVTRTRVTEWATAMHNLLRHWKQAIQEAETGQRSFTAAEQKSSTREDFGTHELQDRERQLVDLQRQEGRDRSRLEHSLAMLRECDDAVSGLKQQCDSLARQNSIATGLAPETLEDKKLREQRSIETLNSELSSTKRHQERFLNAYTAKFIAASMFPGADQISKKLERVIADLRAGDDLQRMGEAMALLKSTIIHFDADLKHLRSVQRLVEGDLENAFKAGHNEVKILVSMCIPKEDVRRFARGGHTCEEWPLSQQMLEEKFPAHKIETVNTALQDMVVAWDGLSTEAKTKLTTAQDVVANAHLLYMIGSFVSLRRAQKWALKYQQVMGVRLPKGTGWSQS